MENTNYLDYNTISSYYSELEKRQPFNLVDEYIQMLILNFINESIYREKLSLIGGSCVRLLYGVPRYSSDLDFDSFNFTEEDFWGLLDYLLFRFSESGFEVEQGECKMRDCWHLEIKIPNYLYENGLIKTSNAKIHLYIDVGFPLVDYNPIEKEGVKPLLKYPVRTCPIDMLLSKKIKAFFERKKWQGKDLFDIIYLLNFTQPDYNYLSQTIYINNGIELKEAFANFFNNPENDLIELARRMERSYVNETDKSIIENGYNVIDMIK